MLKKLWKWIISPSARWSLGVLLLVGVLGGAIGVLGFQTAMDMTNTENFCANACHEMTVNVAAEYKGTLHDVNASGVRATCSDCHVPRTFGPKMVRKIKASLELYHHILGTLDTPEKFEEHRLRLANNVWREMRGNDSRECRNCHQSNNMKTELQTAEAVEYHENPLEQGKTCIDCHKGIAHKLPKELLDAAEKHAALDRPDGNRGLVARLTE
jgi:cytochrome c-type protein NapC